MTDARWDSLVGTIGPNNISLNHLKALWEPEYIPDVVVDALLTLKCKDLPDVYPMCSQSMTKILSGSLRARSHYFCKTNIFNAYRVVIGALLENENHWTLFFCDISKGQISYLNSCGEEKVRKKELFSNWSSFASTKGCTLNWTWHNVHHPKQKDGHSCGVHVLMFAQALLDGKDTVPAYEVGIPQLRAQLCHTLFSALDRTKKCTVCWNILVKDKVQCQDCGVYCHLKCRQTQCVICGTCKSTGKEDKRVFQQMLTGRDAVYQAETENNREYTGEDAEAETENNREDTGEDAEAEAENNREDTGEDAEAEAENNREDTGEDAEAEAENNREDTGEDAKEETGNNKEDTGEDAEAEAENNREDTCEDAKEATRNNRDEETCEDAEAERGNNRDTGEDTEAERGNNREEETGEDAEAERGINRDTGEDEGYRVFGRLGLTGPKKRSYVVTNEEIQRRIQEENMSLSVFRDLLGGRKRNLPEVVLNRPKKTKTKVTIFSALSEGEASDLATGFRDSMCRNIEPGLVAKDISAEDADHTRRTLCTIRQNLSSLESTSPFSLVTHTFGPQAVDGVLGFLIASLQAATRPEQ